LRLTAHRLEKRYSWDASEFPQDDLLSGFQIAFGQHGRIHIRIGSQWSAKVWDIKLDEEFLVEADCSESLGFIKEMCQIINEAQDKWEERPYDIMLNWLLCRPDMASVESFQLKSAGISKIFSFEIREASGRLHEHREGEEELMLEARSREDKHRVHTLTCETNRGVRDPSYTSRL
jgi:hypothetical protein